jgi:hypothetical protein
MEGPDQAAAMWSTRHERALKGRLDVLMGMTNWAPEIVQLRAHFLFSILELLGHKTSLDSMTSDVAARLSDVLS